MSERIILLVEDNAGDVVLFSEAMKSAAVEARLYVVTDGQQATNFLRKTGDFALMPTPDVLVLDLNLPLKSGREVLADLQAEPAIDNIPVAVLSTSMFDQDVCKVYTRALCHYFIKTADFQELKAIVRSIAEIATPPGARP